jgi:hypothetical protein
MTGEIKIVEEGGRLIVERSRRDGCSGVFLLFWLAGWTYGLGIVGGDCLSKPNLVQAWPLLFMVVGEAAAIGVFAFLCTGRELLRIDAYCVEWEMRAVLRFRHRVIRLQDLESVDLLPRDPKPNDKTWAVGTLEFAGFGRKIRFGMGLDGTDLHTVLARVREFIDKQRATALGPAVRAAQVAPVDRAAWEKSWREAHPETTTEKVGQWLMVPILVAFGCLAIVSGVQSLRKGTVWGILCGLFFTAIGLLLSVGLTWASVSVFRDWLRKRK